MYNMTVESELFKGKTLGQGTFGKVKIGIHK